MKLLIIELNHVDLGLLLSRACLFHSVILSHEVVFPVHLKFLDVYVF